MAAIAILAKDSELDHQHAALVVPFKELRSRHWEVHLFHSYREANNVANYLAILYLMAYTSLIPRIGACPTGYTMIL
ncbi:hypothetical protein LINGRAHAP2_LOCUS34125 [Linum grandiflorum]